MRLIRPLIYLVEGELYAGSLLDYAKAEEYGHYAGLDVRGVWQVEVTDLGSDPYLVKAPLSVQSVQNYPPDDDHQTTEFELDGQTVRFTIDLRA